MGGNGSICGLPPGSAGMTPIPRGPYDAAMFYEARLA
jgi:hypothetical protein